MLIEIAERSETQRRYREAEAVEDSQLIESDAAKGLAEYKAWQDGDDDDNAGENGRARSNCHSPLVMRRAF